MPSECRDDASRETALMSDQCGRTISAAGNHDAPHGSAPSPSAAIIHLRRSPAASGWLPSADSDRSRTPVAPRILPALGIGISLTLEDRARVRRHRAIGASERRLRARRCADTSPPRRIAGADEMQVIRDRSAKPVCANEDADHAAITAHDEQCRDMIAIRRSRRDLSPGRVSAIVDASRALRCRAASSEVAASRQLRSSQSRIRWADRCSASTGTRRMGRTGPCRSRMPAASTAAPRTAAVHPMIVEPDARRRQPQH